MTTYSFVGPKVINDEQRRGGVAQQFAFEELVGAGSAQLREHVVGGCEEYGVPRAAVGPMLAHLFQVLNTPKAERARNLEETLATFPYVGQKLFAGLLPIASFEDSLAHLLLECTARDWSGLSSESAYAAPTVRGGAGGELTG